MTKTKYSITMYSPLQKFSDKIKKFRIKCLNIVTLKGLCKLYGSRSSPQKVICDPYFLFYFEELHATVVPTKADHDVIFCLHFIFRDW